MRNFKLNRAVMACILAFAMVFGTCAASFAEINPEAFVDEKAAAIDAKLAEYGIEAGPKTEAIIEIADEKLDEIIETVKGEVEDIIADGEVEKEEIEAAVNEYVEITEEQEAKINEAIAKITEIVAAVKDFSPEEIKAYIAELQAEAVAKLSHKKYAADDDSYYVALGGDTALGTGLVYGETPYYALLADELEVDVKGAAKAGLLPSEVLALVEANEAEIEKADLITYQLDASSFVNAVLSNAELDWSAYIDEETSALLAAVVAKATEIIAEDWEAVANAKVDEIAAEVKAAVLSAEVAEYVVVDPDKLDELITLVVGYVKEITALVEAKKDEAADIAAGLDEATIAYIEKIAFAVVAYAVDTVNAVEKVQEINPDAALYVVGMYNPVKGLKLALGETAIDAEEIFDYVIAATNVYYAGLAAADGKFAFVDVAEVATEGFGGEEKTIEALVSEAMTLSAKMHATADGHEYIKDQIANAMACVEGDYAKLNGTYHNVLCTLCGEVIRKEKHDFDGKVCTLCGYEKKSGGGSGSSGGGGATTIKKEETSSVSKFTDVSKDAWYYDVIKKIVDKGLMNGMSDTSFAPDLEVTRAMFVTILYRAAGAPQVEAAANFADVAADQYYANAVAWAAANGIVNGVSEIEFAPNNDITREQMATILYRYNKKAAEAAEVAYTDKDSISEYAMEAVAWAKAAGIMQGNADGTFAPVRNASRAEAAAVFARLLGL